MRRFQQLARELNVVLPASVFERAGNAFYNSVAIIDAGGAVLGIYRKAHIPESPGLSREVLLLARRHRLQGLAHALRHARRRDLLGPVVPGVGARDGAAGRRDPVLSDGDRLGAAGSQHRFARSLAARDAGPLGVEHHAAGGVESHRHGARRALGSHVLRLFVHHRSRRARSSQQADRERRGGRHRDVRSRRDSRVSHGVGRVPRSPPGAVRPADDAGRAMADDAV